MYARCWLSAGVVSSDMVYVDTSPCASHLHCCNGTAAHCSAVWFPYKPFAVQVRLSRKLRVYLRAGPTAAPERVRKADVLARLERGVWINVLGLASTLLGLQVGGDVSPHGGCRSTEPLLDACMCTTQGSGSCEHA